MSMQLTLAKIDAALLDAIRQEPALLSRIFGRDNRPWPDELATTLGDGDLFSADFRSLDAIAASRESRAWFDRATGGTDTVDYGLNYGPAFVLSPAQVSEVAAGLVAEGWGADPTDRTGSTGETEADVERSARALGEAADWDPDELEAYGPMMAATGTADFNRRVVRAMGTLAGWADDTTDRVAAAVAAAEPEPLDFTDEYDLGGFFAAAARAGQAMVGGVE